MRYLVFFVVELKSRAVHIAGVRLDPGEAWVLQAGCGSSGRSACAERDRLASACGVGGRHS